MKGAWLVLCGAGILDVREIILLITCYRQEPMANRFTRVDSNVRDLIF